MARGGNLGDDRQALKVLGGVVAWLENDDPKRHEAAAFALERAKRLGWTAAVRSYQRVLDGEPEPVRASDRLAAVERDLVELFPVSDTADPDSVNAERSMRTGLLTRKAQLLMDCGRAREAEKLVRDILANTEFPESGIEPTCCILDDGFQAAPLLTLLGKCEVRRGETRCADEHFCPVAQPRSTSRYSVPP